MGKLHKILLAFVVVMAMVSVGVVSVYAFHSGPGDLDPTLIPS